jgi:hypothetical protein
VKPAVIEREADRLLMLPGDPLNPAPDGFEVPPETRSLVKNGKFTPL